MPVFRTSIASTAGWLSLLLLLAPDVVRADPADSTRRSHGVWTLLPIVFKSPDTGWGIGVLPQYVFRTTRESRPSQVRLEAYYTQNGQFDVRLSSGLWLPGDRYEANGAVRLQTWPTTFYGTGNRLLNAAGETYSERIVQATFTVLRRIRPGLYAGVGYDLRHSEMLEAARGGALASGTVTGGAGGTVSSVGAFLSFDSRNAVYYPTRGGIVRLETRVSGRVTGSDYGFALHRIEAAHYASPGGRHVIAVHGALRLSSRVPPFQLLPGVGQVVRGYSSKRLVDRHLLAFQLEYRLVPVVWRLGLAVFAGAGQVAHDLGDFSIRRFHPAAGLGLRFQLIRSESVNVRWDFGFGPNSTGDYLDLNEAF